MCVIVKLVRIGKKVEEYEISDNPSVGELLKKAGLSYRPGTITVNQSTVSEDDILDDGDTVYIGDSMKGNIPFTVKIIRLGHSDAIIELPCESGTTIHGLLNTLPEGDKAKFFKDGGKPVYEYRINGGENVEGDATIPTPADAGTPVRLVMSTRTKGNE